MTEEEAVVIISDSEDEESRPQAKARPGRVLVEFLNQSPVHLTITLSCMTISKRLEALNDN